MAKGRLVLDILLTLALLSVVVLTRRYYRRRAAGTASPFRGVFTLAAVVAVMVAGVVFVHATRIMWDDFLAATPAMMIFHPSIERLLRNFWQKLKLGASALFRARP